MPPRRTVSQFNPLYIQTWLDAAEQRIEFPWYEKGVNGVVNPHNRAGHFRSDMYALRKALERENPDIFRAIASVCIHKESLGPDKCRIVMQPVGASYAEDIMAAVRVPLEPEEEE